MALPDDTLVYYLTFNAPGAKDGVRSTLTVVSEHIAIIQKFIDIHPRFNRPVIHQDMADAFLFKICYQTDYVHKRGF